MGDFGFLLGIAAVLMAFNSLDHADVFAAAPLMSSMTVQVIPDVDFLVADDYDLHSAVYGANG